MGRGIRVALLLLAPACAAAGCSVVHPATTPPTYGDPRSGGSA